MKRVVRAASDGLYNFADLSDEAKENALKDNEVQDYLYEYNQLNAGEDIDSLEYSLDSIECKLTRDSFNYAISTRYYDIDLTPRGEDIFSVNGLDGDYHVDFPDVESNGLFVGEIFVEMWKDGLSDLKSKASSIDSFIDSYLASSEDAEENLYYYDTDVKEVGDIEKRLGDLREDYLNLAKKASDAAVDVIEADVNVDYDIDSATDVLVMSSLLFYENGDLA